MLALLATAALASDPASGLLSPSLGLSDDRVEGYGTTYIAKHRNITGMVGASTAVRSGRLGAGGEFGEDFTGGRSGTAWVSVALVDRGDLRVSPWVRGGTYAQAGLSVAGRFHPRGFRRRGLLADFSWGPALDVRLLKGPRWGGFMDPIRSMPEFGLTADWGMIQLRIGAIGPAPVATYRLQTPGRTSFVLEYSIGGFPGLGVVGMASVGVARSREPGPR
ncbi:MAG: hypothetical protein H6737_27230 [Alphaproteobacteria bacterium]|nr:hypothetical protein [Alphaproteobacteria bacterium]